MLGFHYRYEAGAEAARTLLLLHGTGADENDLIPLGRALDPEANRLSPRGKVLENGMPRFFRRIAEGVLDVEDLKARTHELVGFIDATAKEHGFDRSRVAAAGFSNGANIAASTLLLRPDVLRAAILFRPMIPFEPETKPDLQGVRVFIGAGRNDPLVDPEDAERLATILGDAGAEVELAWDTGGHGLQPHEVVTARDWLAAPEARSSGT
jgi:phospholipase/carboxylesterase/glyoxalase family protein